MMETFSIFGSAVLILVYSVLVLIGIFGFKKIGYNIAQSLFIGLTYPILFGLDFLVESISKITLILGGTSDAELNAKMAAYVTAEMGEE
jgi:hypothetical protein